MVVMMMMVVVVMMEKKDKAEIKNYIEKPPSGKQTYAAMEILLPGANLRNEGQTRHYSYQTAEETHALEHIRTSWNSRVRSVKLVRQ